MHYLFLPRKARDSNPRYSYPYTAFRVRPIRPLWQLSKATAKLQTEITQYNKQSQLELNKANRQVQDAENKVNLTKLALEQSKEAYRIRKNRYDQGLEKSSDLLMSETTMSQKDLEYQQAIFEYNVALEYYKFLKN